MNMNLGTIDMPEYHAYKRYLKLEALRGLISDYHIYIPIPQSLGSNGLFKGKSSVPWFSGIIIDNRPMYKKIYINTSYSTPLQYIHLRAKLDFDLSIYLSFSHRDWDKYMINDYLRVINAENKIENLI